MLFEFGDFLHKLRINDSDMSSELYNLVLCFVVNNVSHELTRLGIPVIEVELLSLSNFLKNETCFLVKYCSHKAFR